MKNIRVSYERAKGIQGTGTFTFLAIPFVLSTKNITPVSTKHDSGKAFFIESFRSFRACCICYSRTGGFTPCYALTAFSVFNFCVCYLILFAMCGNACSVTLDFFGNIFGNDGDDLLHAFFNVGRNF